MTEFFKKIPENLNHPTRIIKQLGFEVIHEFQSQDILPIKND